MTDSAETQAATPADNISACNKDIVFKALAEAGIHRVTVEYDGSGDSGQIENVEAWDAGNQNIPLPSAIKVQLASGNPDHPADPINLEAAVEEIAWSYLYDQHYGWENNDGAYGTFVFDVPARTITLEHNERYTEVNTSTHEF